MARVPSQEVLANYDPQWPVLYEEEKTKILSVIGDKVVAIDHIGSTSIPGSRAKPIIDILVGIRHLEDVEGCIEPLHTIGYEYRPGNKQLILNTEYFRKGPSGANTHHVRMVEAESDLWQQYTLFRDYLRMHAEEAQRYERLKVEAYERHGRYLPLEAKKNFIESIIAKARSEGNSSSE